MKKTDLRTLTESAVMLALSIVLSFLRFRVMPQGGSVTVCSMLPIFLIAFRRGTRTGLATAFCLSLFQLVQGLDNLSYCVTPLAAVGCVALDYLLPYTALGLAGLFRNRGVSGKIGGILLASSLRYAFHVASGVLVWGEYAEDLFGLSLADKVFLYSAIYNGSFMIPETILTTAAAALLCALPATKGLLEKKF